MATAKNSNKKTTTAPGNKSSGLANGNVLIDKWAAPLLFLFSIALYINTLGHGYALDDSVAIIENKFTKQGFAGIPDLLTKDFFTGIYDHALELGGGRYRPLSLVTFAIEYQFLGENPGFSHLLNVLLYGLSCALMYFVFCKIMPQFKWTVLAASFLFAAHPIHTEVVANIKSRDEILCFLFLILTLKFLYSDENRKQTRNLIIAGILFFMALLSKEMAITFLAVIPLLLYFFPPTNFPANIKSIFIRSVPFLITGFLFVALRTSLVGFIGDRENFDVNENPFVLASAGEKSATIFYILGKYVLLLIFPHPLSSDYSYNQIPYANWGEIGPIAVLVFIIIMVSYAIWGLRKKDIFSFCILYFGATTFLVSNIVFNIGAPMGERFMYIPSFAFCLFSGALMQKLFFPEGEPSTRKLPFFVISILLILVLSSTKTISRNKDWKDNVTLFEADVATVPNSAKTNYYYANSLLKTVWGDDKRNMKGRNETLKKSLSYFQKSLEINPKFILSLYNCGLIWNEMGNADSSLKYLNRLLILEPKHINSQSVLGSVYGKLLGNYDKAIEHLKIAVFYNPKDNASYENMGIAYAMKHDTDSAMIAFEKALKINPRNAKVLLNMGITCDFKGDKAKAEEYYQKAFSIDPALKEQRKR